VRLGYHKFALVLVRIQQNHKFRDLIRNLAPGQQFGNVLAQVIKSAALREVFNLWRTVNAVPAKLADQATASSIIHHHAHATTHRSPFSKVEIAFISCAQQREVPKSGKCLAYVGEVVIN
jgi:hypothetical protein